MPQYASIIEHADDARTRIQEVEYPEIDHPGVNGTVYLDVRGADEFNSGHINGALHLPWVDIEAKAEGLIPKKETPIVTYCAVGHRSAIAADYLQALGYTAVISIKGGLQAIGEGTALALVA